MKTYIKKRFLEVSSGPIHAHTLINWTTVKRNTSHSTNYVYKSAICFIHNGNFYLSAPNLKSTARALDPDTNYFQLTQLAKPTQPKLFDAPLLLVTVHIF